MLLIYNVRHLLVDFYAPLLPALACDGVLLKTNVAQ